MIYRGLSSLPLSEPMVLTLLHLSSFIMVCLQHRKDSEAILMKSIDEKCFALRLALAKEKKRREVYSSKCFSIPAYHTMLCHVLQMACCAGLRGTSCFDDVRGDRTTQ